jgi:hypothetical protein
VHDLGDDLAHGTGDRLDSVLHAAELERADTLEDDLTSRSACCEAIGASRRRQRPSHPA